MSKSQGWFTRLMEWEMTGKPSNNNNKKVVSLNKARKKKDNNSNIFKILFILLVLYLAWHFFYSMPMKMDYYSSCVNDCVYYADTCMIGSTKYDKSGNGYVLKLDSEICLGDLDSCVYDCEP